MTAEQAGLIGLIVALVIQLPNHPSINGWARIGRWSWARIKRASRWLAARMFVRVPDVDPMPRARMVGRSSRARRERPGAKIG